MTSPPPSIASFIAGQGDAGLGESSDESQAALLTYLRAEYAGSPRHIEQSSFAGELAALPSHNYRFATAGPVSETEQAGPAEHGPSSSGYAQTTPHSPPNPAITIPASLAELAAQATATFNIPNLALGDYSHISFPKGEDTGEMGGKRRKLPHERAGWKEMDQEPRTKRKRGGRRAEENIGNGLGHGEGSMGDMGYLTAQVTPKGEQAHLAMGGGTSDPSFGSVAGEADGDPLQGNRDQGNQDGATLDAGAETDIKPSRAAQNRKAQQVYRRKREEKMKELENQTAALAETRHNLSLAESKLKEFALSLEGKHIENLALRVALRNLSQLGHGILDNDSALITQIGTRPREGIEETTSEVDQAFKTLEAQSRELAKANRKRAL